MLDTVTHIALPVARSFDIARAPVAVGAVRRVELLTVDYGQAHGRIYRRPGARDGRKESQMAKKDEPVVQENVALEPLHPLPQGGAGLVAKGLVERVPVTLTVELGRTTIAVKDLRQLRHGQIVVLDQTVGEPLGIYANGHRIAFGEVVSVGKDQYGIRVTTLADASDPRKDAAE